MAEAAAARADACLPVQAEMAELVGLPEVARRTIAKRQGGRPPGARNKRLDEIARAVRERFGDVLVQQLAIATMPIEDLMAAGLSVKDAFEERRLSAAVVLPYIEQRQAVRVDVTNHKVVTLTFVEGERDQGVIDAALAQSDDWQSDAAANPLTWHAGGDDGQLIADQPAADPEGGPPPPGGPLFAGRAPDRAPAGVLNPEGRIFDRENPEFLAGEGGGR